MCVSLCSVHLSITCVYMHVCMCVCMRVYVCMHVRACVYVCVCVCSVRVLCVGRRGGGGLEG